jgi:hypothetical protein
MVVDYEFYNSANRKEMETLSWHVYRIQEKLFDEKTGDEKLVTLSL